MTFVRFGVYALCVLLSLESRMVGGNELSCEGRHFKICLTEVCRNVEEGLSWCISFVRDECENQDKDLDVANSTNGKCPGLAYKECATKAKACVKDVPPPISNTPGVYISPNSTMCQDLKKVFTVASNCLDNLKTTEMCRKKTPSQRITWKKNHLNSEKAECESHHHWN